jgi:Flp pilus assembly protein TadG
MPIARSQALHHDGRGQATVEFALVAIILLTMFFGVVDFGRMLAIHAAAVTSSREAARFGSALGYPAASPPVEPYLDCAGIKQAARSVAGGLLPGDTVITVQYDHGPSTSPHADCEGGAPPTRNTIDTLDRVIVTTTVTYRPLVPLFEPFLNQVTVVSTDRRTIVKPPT